MAASEPRAAPRYPYAHLSGLQLPAALRGAHRLRNIHLVGTKNKRGRGRPRKATNAFGRWIDQSRLTRDQVADRLDITRTHLDRLCCDSRRPDLESAFAIEAMTRGKVTAKSWLKAPKHSGD